MTLNGTIIIQIFNFIIAYLIIDRLLLRKSVALIQQERWQQDSLMKDIQIERTRVSENKAEKKMEWEQFCQQFKQESPKIISQPSFTKFEQKVAPSKKPSSTDVKHFATELEKLLIEKVTHVSK